MIIDGRKIAEEIYGGIRNRITHLNTRPHLTVFTCAPNFATRKFLDLKKRKVTEVGIDVNVIEFPGDIITEEAIQSMESAAMQTDGLIVQLPFPPAIDIDKVLQNIPAPLDVDAALYDGTEADILPPVIGAIKAISERHDILWTAAKVVVIGEGRLVGKPAAIWARQMGAEVEVINQTSQNTKAKLQAANIIISGAGQPGLIKPDDIQEGVIIFDAGTSEEGGELKGDADPACAEKASLFTPVPGGIGPITVAVLLRNLVRLMELR